MTGSGAEGKHGSIIRAEAWDSEGLLACSLFSSFNLNKACGAGHGISQEHLGKLDSSLDFVFSLLSLCGVTFCM